MTRASRIADPIDIGKVAKPPAIRLPDPMTVFARRAERFADVASGNPMADFLSFMAEIVRAQTAALGVLAVATPPETCSGWATPPLDRSKWRPDPSWRHALTVILDRLDAAALTAETRKLAACIAEASSLVIGIGKQAYYTQIDLDQPKAYAYAKEVMTMNSLAADAQEGISAFLEKRAACWTGK